MLPIDTITFHGGKIQELDLRDHYRNGMDPLSVEDLTKIKERCPELRELTIDLPLFPCTYWSGREASSFEAEEALKLLATFEKLKKLSLLTEVSLGTSDFDLATSTDPDYDDAEAIMKELHVSKSGTPFEKITLCITFARPPATWIRAAEANGGRDLHHFSACRVFCSVINAQGVYEQWVESGPRRIDATVTPQLVSAQLGT